MSDDREQRADPPRTDAAEADAPVESGSTEPSRPPLFRRLSRGMIDDLTNDDRGSTLLAGIAAGVLVAVLVLFKSC